MPACKLAMAVVVAKLDSAWPATLIRRPSDCLQGGGGSFLPACLFGILWFFKHFPRISS